MRWKRKISEAYEKSMNFKYDLAKAKEGLTFAVKEKKPNHMLRKVLVPVLCSVSGVGIILTSYFVIQNSGANKDMAQEKSYNTLSRFDQNDEYFYGFAVEGNTLCFQYYPKRSFLAVEFASALDVMNLTVKDNGEETKYDSVECGYTLDTKSSHTITWNYVSDTLNGEGSFEITAKKSTAVEKDRKA